MKNRFQLIEKFKHVQTSQLIENKKERIASSLEGKTWQENRKYPVNIIS